jgi:hypothetical protein
LAMPTHDALVKLLKANSGSFTFVTSYIEWPAGFKPPDDHSSLFIFDMEPSEQVAVAPLPRPIATNDINDV